MRKLLAQYFFKETGYETATGKKTGKYKTGYQLKSTVILQNSEVNVAEMNPEAKARYDAENFQKWGLEENNLGYLGFTSKLPEEEHQVQLDAKKYRIY
jgi:hypothetical protein